MIITIPIMEEVADVDIMTIADKIGVITLIDIITIEIQVLGCKITEDLMIHPIG